MRTNGRPKSYVVSVVGDLSTRLCSHGGSSLFFDHGKKEPMGIAAGSFGQDLLMKLAAHIYVDEGAYDDYQKDDIDALEEFQIRFAGERVATNGRKLH